MDSPAPSLRLLDQVRQQARYRHYSLRTEEAYVYWVRFFVRWSGLRHPRDMGVTEVRAFLTMLATERRVSASTHNQALSALLFLYRHVLGIDLPWMQELQRPSAARRIRSSHPMKQPRFSHTWRARSQSSQDCCTARACG